VDQNFLDYLQEELQTIEAAGLFKRRWLGEVYQKVVDAIPAEHRARLEPIEVFHEVIEHKWYLSEKEGADVGFDRALRSYLDSVLPHSADERQLVVDSNEGYIGWG
jgi:hypothetical protein